MANEIKRCPSRIVFKEERNHQGSWKDIFRDSLFARTISDDGLGIDVFVGERDRL
jgi:hypothetical protein